MGIIDEKKSGKPYLQANKVQYHRDNLLLDKKNPTILGFRIQAWFVKNPQIIESRKSNKNIYKLLKVM